MTTYFHVAPILLDEGSIILPGNFGRIVKKYNPNSVNFDVLTRETIFEQIRQQEFNAKPSRLHCLFLLESLEQAVQYKNQYAIWNLIYEVSINSENLTIHRGSYSFNVLPPIQILGTTSTISPPNILHNNGYYNGLPELARTYWSTDPSSDIEVLINAPATVVRHHDSF